MIKDFRNRKNFKRSLPVRAVLVCLCLGISFFARAQETTKLPSVDVTKLQLEIGKRISRVEEFRFIREQAQKIGVRAWLFGGTAAGFAHYVKWDLERANGDPRFQPDRFDYDYMNIYRSTQDLDIVVDGTPEQALQFRQILTMKYQHVQGSKSAWEVRCLRYPMGEPSQPGYKEALLNDPEFINQNTDSNSVGMIEVSTPLQGENVVRDLRDWNSTRPTFLRDVTTGEIHYYFSLTHEETGRFRAGKNPPIFSVIRLLTKAFQYELIIEAQQWPLIQKVINEFDPNRDLANPQARAWIEKNAPKLIQHAVNIEYAITVLDKLGLRKKLIALGSPTSINTMSWWLNREPLRSFEVGRGGGRTASEIASSLGMESLTVAHETIDFLSYESITRAHTGDPNVLMSRANAAGEGAAFGDGFYTKIGRLGARNTGFTIRFIVDAKAREGEDFTVKDDFMIFRNKKALRVIPESLHMSVLEYFELLYEHKAFDSSDKALIEKQNRLIKTKSGQMSSEDFKKIRSLVLEDLRRPDLNEALFDAWVSLGGDLWDDEMIAMIIKNSKLDYFSWLQISSDPKWNKAYQKVRTPNRFEKNSIWAIAFEIIERINPELNVRQRLEITENFRTALNSGDRRLFHRSGWTFAVNLLNRPDIKPHPELVIPLLVWLRDTQFDTLLLNDVVHYFGVGWIEYRDQLFPTILSMLEKESNRQSLNTLAAQAFLQQSSSNEKWIEHMINRGKEDPSMDVLKSLAGVMVEPGISDRLFDKWIDASLHSKYPRFVLEGIFQNVIPRAPRFKDPQYLRSFIERYYDLPELRRDEYSVIRNAMMGRSENLQNEELIKSVMDNAIRVKASSSLNFLAEMFTWPSFSGREDLLRYYSQKVYEAHLDRDIPMYTGPSGKLPNSSDISSKWILKSQWKAIREGRIHPAVYVLARFIETSFNQFSFQDQEQLILDQLEMCKQVNDFHELKTLAKVIFSKPDLGGHPQAFRQFMEVVDRVPSERAEIMSILPISAQLGGQTCADLLSGLAVK